MRPIAILFGVALAAVQVVNLTNGGTSPSLIRCILLALACLMTAGFVLTHSAAALVAWPIAVVLWVGRLFWIDWMNYRDGIAFIPEILLIEPGMLAIGVGIWMVIYRALRPPGQGRAT